MLVGSSKLSRQIEESPQNLNYDMTILECFNFPGWRGISPRHGAAWHGSRHSPEPPAEGTRSALPWFLLLHNPGIFCFALNLLVNKLFTCMVSNKKIYVCARSRDYTTF